MKGIAICKHCEKPIDKSPRISGNICFICKKQSIAIRALRKAREKAFKKALQKVVKKVAKKVKVIKKVKRKFVKPKAIAKPKKLPPVPLNSYYLKGKLYIPE